MNIFILDNDPTISGMILKKADPRRAKKMVIEFLQASAVLAEDLNLPPITKINDEPYKTALARRFPKQITNWLRAGGLNFEWVLKMCLSMSPETISKKNYKILCLISILLPKGQTPFINYAKSKLKDLDFTNLPIIEAYYQYLAAQGVKLL